MELGHRFASVSLFVCPDAGSKWSFSSTCYRVCYFRFGDCDPNISKFYRIDYARYTRAYSGYDRYNRFFVALALNVIVQSLYSGYSGYEVDQSLDIEQLQGIDLPAARSGRGRSIFRGQRRRHVISLPFSQSNQRQRAGKITDLMMQN